MNNKSPNMLIFKKKLCIMQLKKEKQKGLIEYGKRNRNKIQTK